MRKTREELLDRHPSWNEAQTDIVKAFYGDESLRRYGQKNYDFYDQLEDGTLKNILLLDAWIWKICGDYDDYRLLNGGMRVAVDRSYITGDLHINGYHIFYNNIYSKKNLQITKIIGEKVRGWSNYKAYCSSRIERNNEELNDETIMRVLKHKEWMDYGEPVQRFRDAVVKLYESDKTNHYLDEWRLE